MSLIGCTAADCAQWRQGRLCLKVCVYACVWLWLWFSGFTDFCQESSACKHLKTSSNTLYKIFCFLPWREIHRGVLELAFSIHTWSGEYLMYKDMAPLGSHYCWQMCHWDTVLQQNDSYSSRRPRNALYSNEQLHFLVKVTVNKWQEVLLSMGTFRHSLNKWGADFFKGLFSFPL